MLSSVKMQRETVSNSTLNMANSVRLFEFIKKCYRIVGLESTQENRQHPSFNSTNCIVISLMVQMIMSLVAFLLLEAKSVLEYGRIFYGLESTVSAMIIYVISIRQINNISTFIEDCDGFIESSMKSC